MWRLMPTLFSSDEEDTWLDGPLFSMGLDKHPGMGTLGYEYHQALKFAFKVICRLSLQVPTPTTVPEQVFTTLVTLTGAVVYIIFLARVVKIIVATGPAAQKFKTTYDSIVSYMDAVGVPPQIHNRVRTYLINCEEMIASSYYTSLLDTLSPELQGNPLPTRPHTVLNPPATAPSHPRPPLYALPAFQLCILFNFPGELAAITLGAPLKRVPFFGSDDPEEEQVQY
jgi:hypothetical protein